MILVCRRCLLVASLLVPLYGCAAEQKQFASPDAAVDSFVTALRAKDTGKLKKIFGPESEGVMSSGDPVADRAEVARFLAAYDAQHRVKPEPTGDHTLLVGQSDWPFPVPIIEDEEGKYIFDTAAGRDEILNRRIGRNELATQMVCLAIIDGQRDYVAMRPMGGSLPVYARKLMSDAGTKNGLFWPTAAGEPPSPLGNLVAFAAAEGYGPRSADEMPAYHGYRYRLCCFAANVDR